MNIQTNLSASPREPEGGAVTEAQVVRAHAAWVCALGKMPESVEVVMTTDQARAAIRSALEAALAERQVVQPVGWIAACALSELRAGRVTTVWPEHDHLAEPVALCLDPSAPHPEPQA